MCNQNKSSINSEEQFEFDYVDSHFTSQLLSTNRCLLLLVGIKRKVGKFPTSFSKKLPSYLGTGGCGAQIWLTYYQTCTLRAIPDHHMMKTKELVEAGMSLSLHQSILYLYLFLAVKNGLTNKQQVSWIISLQNGSIYFRITKIIRNNANHFTERTDDLIFFQTDPRSTLMYNSWKQPQMKLQNIYKQSRLPSFSILAYRNILFQNFTCDSSVTCWLEP